MIEDSEGKKVSKVELEEIAQRYHLADAVEDIFIENIYQKHSLHWVLASLEPESSILEFGYGDGIFTEGLVSAGHSVTVLEGAKSIVDSARGKFKDSIVVHHVLFEDFEPDTTYDCIVMSHVLEHVVNPVEILRIVRRALRKEGKAFLLVPNKESIHRQLAVEMGLQPELDTLSERDHVVGHRRVYSFSTLEEDIAAAGLEVKERKGFFLKVLPNSLMLDFSPDLINALNEISDRIPQHLLANIGMIVESPEE